MKRLICLLVALGIVVSTAGCVNPMLGLVSVLEENNVVSFFEDIERVVPPPSFVKSYLETTTIGTGEDKDIFDFEDCDWDVQKYSTVGSYNTRSDKGWFITMDISKMPTNYYLSSPGSLYVGHGNHKLYDDAHGLQGYYTPSSLRISQYAGKGGVGGGNTWDGMYTASGSTRVNSPLFVMKENYVTAYMYYDMWADYTYPQCNGAVPYINIKVQLIDATSGSVLSEQVFERSYNNPLPACNPYYGCVADGVALAKDNLSNMEGMWRPVILNGSAYKGRTVFLRIDTTMISGQQWGMCYGYTATGTGVSFDVYFDEIHFSDEYGDYITYTQSVPPVPNFSYTTNNNLITCDGTVSTDNGIIINYRWEWGDGSLSVGPTASHTYSASGTYQVRLSVTDDEQLTNSVTKSISITMPPPPDTDHDGVPDSLDACPTVAGVASNNGCPNPDYLDDDGDGVINLFDRCRTTPGPASNYGCPIPVPVDTDGDGVADTEDNCPTVVGPATNKGCPVPAVTDTDGDGVADSIDNCDTQAGPASNDGCPIVTLIDTDGDGTYDVEDTCPTVAGPASNHGCPVTITTIDSDGDGIIDLLDQCDTQAGPASNNGCPIPQAVDTDGDGTPDSTDNCDTEAGPASNNGCPIVTQIDSDGDGVIDTEDNCPYEIGSSLNYGCPSIEDEDDDNDGIPNSEDDCPYQAGDVSHNGCPYTPPTTSSTTTTTSTTSSTTATTTPFPYWGFFVFCMIVLGFFGVLYYVIKKPKLKGLGRKTKRKVSKK